MYLSQYFEQNPVLLFVFIAWSLVWKGLALWKAGREGQKWWFIAILVINTVGILEIFYLYIWPKLEPKLRKKKVENTEVK